MQYHKILQFTPTDVHKKFTIRRTPGSNTFEQNQRIPFIGKKKKV
jgi:hypothetical protein